ncbi:MAG: hypothetical protein ABEJ65_07685 [bacterium]
MKTGFILSTGRTGTDFFTHFFNNVVKNSWSLHEPTPAFKRRSFELVSRGHTLYEKIYFKIPRLYRHLLRDKDYYIESNYHLFSLVPLLREAFEDPIVIHVIRDGRDVVRSWLNRGWFLDDPGSKLSPHYFEGYDQATDCWEDWNALEKVAWYWKAVNEVIHEQSPDVTVYFEDIFYDKHEGIYEILDQFDDMEYRDEGVQNSFQQKVNKSTHKLVPKYPEWPDSWKEQFQSIAGNAMEKWEYDDSYGGNKETR